MGDTFRPPWLRNATWFAYAASVLLNVAAAPLAAGDCYYGSGEPAKRDCKPSNRGCKPADPPPIQVPDLRVAREEKLLGRPPWEPPKECAPSPEDYFAGDACGICEVQLKNRSSMIEKTRAELLVACGRHRFAWTSLPKNEPDARRVLEEESKEAAKLTRRLEGLVGEPLWKRYLFVLGLVAMLVTLEATFRWFAWHARRAQIHAPQRSRELAVPFVLIGLVTLAVAAWVTYVESVGANKTDFDAVSYCFSRGAFWLSHVTLLPVAFAVAAPLALGWYTSRSDHLPQPDPTQFRWGVRSYVSFLETWSFLGVALTGVTAAAWMHTIADAPSLTNRTVAFLGTGAVLAVAVVVARLLWCGILLHRRYLTIAEASENHRDLPPDPLDGFVGDRWWIAPAALVAAFALAYKAFELAGALSFFGGG